MRSLIASLSIFSAVSSALLFGACGPVGSGTDCTNEAAANFSIIVLDTATSQRVCDATVSATDEKTGETQRLTGFGTAGSCSYSGGFYERVGTFSISASKSGYVSDTKSGVVVRSGVCHIEPVNLTLKITP